MTDPDMGSWSYSYDSLGNLTGQTDARTCTTSLTYDNLNRLANKSYTGTCSTTTSAVSYSYDAGTNGKGHRTGMTDASGSAPNGTPTTTWAYDTRGRVTGETKYIGADSFTTGWTYNQADQMTSMTYPDGEVLTTTYLPQMTPDTLIGNISGTLTTYVSDSMYDYAGRITTRVFNTSNFRQVYSYVPWTGAGGGSLDMVKAGTNTGSYNNILNLGYTYDVDRNITSIYDGKLLNTQTFTYDALNRLTSAVATGGQGFYALQSYTYNSTTGNLASKAGMTLNYGDAAHKHAVSSTTNPATSYTYDANGNQVTRTVGGVTHTLTYDAENRLVKVMNGSTTIASFVYDGDGQRVKSTLNGVTTTFVGNYYEKTGTSITKYYYMGTTRVAMRNSTVKYLFGDQLGSTSVTTSSSGVIGSQARYKPFGEMYYTSGTLPTRYTFTGQYSYTITTSEIGLMYYGARFYDPLLGRFSSADTLIPEPGNPQSWDRYSYSNNNPVNYFDPSGHISIPVSTDTCGPDGIYCLNNSNINWDPTTDPGLSKTDKALAEQTYLEAMENPGYFLNLYFNKDGSLWESDEVNYLDIYLQYSNMHMTAEEYILRGMDICSARLARFYYISGNMEMGDVHLTNAIEIVAAAVVPLGLGNTGRTEPLNLKEKLAMEEVMSNPNGRPLPWSKNMTDSRWLASQGWIKMYQDVNGVQIHYLFNPNIGAYDDFKFH